MKWRKSLFGITRNSKATGASVKLVPLHDGAIRVIVSRPVPCGRNVYTGQPTYLYRITHTRTFKAPSC